MEHFNVVCLVAWPLKESDAAIDLVLMSDVAAVVT